MLRSIKFSRLVFAAAALALSALGRGALATPITLTNPDFESNNLPNENSTAFNLVSFGGWFPSSPAFVNNNFPNTGPFNVPPGDITIETPAGDATIGNANGDEDENPDNTFPKMALHIADDARVNQITSHVINTAQDLSFTLTVDVGNEINPATARGYNIALYGQSGGVRTIIATMTGGDPGNNAWLTKTLTISAAQFAAFNGQLIGVSLYQNSLVTGGTRPALYDNVSLSVTPIPEPGSFAICIVGLAAMGVFSCRKRCASIN